MGHEIGHTNEKRLEVSIVALDEADSLLIFPSESELPELPELPAQRSAVPALAQPSPPIIRHLELDELSNQPRRVDEEFARVVRAADNLEARLTAATAHLVALETNIQDLRADIDALSERRLAALKNELAALVDGSSNQTALTIPLEDNHSAGATRVGHQWQAVLQRLFHESRTHVAADEGSIVRSATTAKVARSVRYTGSALSGIVCVWVLIRLIDVQHTPPAAASEYPAISRNVAADILLAPDQKSRLQAPPPALSIPSAWPPAVPARSAATDVQPLPPRASRWVGTLAVSSVPPGAVVLINRQKMGVTPIQFSELPAGNHLVWLEQEGYERWTSSVAVPADKVTRIAARLEITRP